MYQKLHYNMKVLLVKQFYLCTWHVLFSTNVSQLPAKAQLIVLVY